MPTRPTTPRTLWRSWIVYGLSSIASRLIALIMLPIYTRVLSPEEYGIRAMVTVGADLVGMLFSLGITTAMIRHYVGEGGDDRRPEAVSTGYITCAIVLGVGVCLAILFAPWLSVFVLGDAAHARFLRLGLVSLFFINTMDVGIAYLRLRQRAMVVAIVSLSTLLLTLLTNIALVVVLRWGVAGILYGEIMTFGICSLLLAWLTLREVGVRFSVALSRRMIVYGAPLTLMPCVWLVVNQSGGVFLTHYGSLSSAGIYALVMQCAQVLLVAVILPFRDAWEPGQFEVARDPAGGRVYRRMFQTVTFTIVMAAFTFAVGAEDVIRVLAAPAFHAAAAVVPILLAAHVVTGMSLFFNSALLASNRTALLGLIALVTAAVNLAGNMVLVPRYLAAGAAISRLVAVIVMAALTYAIARRVWPHRVDLVALAKLIVLALAGFGVSRLLPDETLVVSLAIKALLVVALVAASLLVGAVDRGDVARVSAFLRGRLGPWRRRAAAGTVR